MINVKKKKYICLKNYNRKKKSVLNKKKKKNKIHCKEIKMLYSKQEMYGEKKGKKKCMLCYGKSRKKKKGWSREKVSFGKIFV